jgi:predicted nucleic acid-binding protein
MRAGQVELLNRYDGFFSRRPFVFAEISAAIVERATELRATHGFKTPDAIHLATAMVENADAVLTGDAALARCPGLRVDVI